MLYFIKTLPARTVHLGGLPVVVRVSGSDQGGPRGVRWEVPLPGKSQEGNTGTGLGLWAFRVAVSRSQARILYFPSCFPRAFSGVE